jgi:hypothetical protein
MVNKDSKLKEGINSDNKLEKYTSDSVNSMLQTLTHSSSMQDNHRSQHLVYNRRSKNSKFYRTNQDIINNLISTSKNINIDVDSYNSLKIYHQNICGLKYKTDELISSLESNLPRVICLTEPHLNQNEMESISILRYKLGAQYCRKNYLKGGTCIFLHETLEYETINLKKLSSDLDIEVCAIIIVYILKNVYFINL